MISWKTRTKSYKTTSVVSLATWPRAKWIAVRKHAKHKNKPAFFQTDVARWPDTSSRGRQSGGITCCFAAGGAFYALHTVTDFTEIRIIFTSLQRIPGQRICLLTAHSSGRSMSYMPNVSMSRSHKIAGLGNSWLRFLFRQMGSALNPGAILRLPFSHTSYLPPDWFEWPPWNTPHLGFKRHEIIISTVPLLKRGEGTEPGEAESESFTQGGGLQLFVTSLHACLHSDHLTSWHLNFQFFITSSSKSVCNLFYPI